MKEKRGTSL